MDCPVHNRTHQDLPGRTDIKIDSMENMVDADYILSLTEKVNKLLVLQGQEEAKEITTTNSLKSSYFSNESSLYRSESDLRSNTKRSMELEGQVYGSGDEYYILLRFCENGI